MAKTPKANDTFHRLVNGKGAKAKLNRSMLIKNMLIEMKRHGIRYPTNLQYYSVEEHVPLIQKYLNEKFPGEYRLSIFGENGQTRPIWKGSDRAQKDICIYINEGHYYGIRKLNSLSAKIYIIAWTVKLPTKKRMSTDKYVQQNVHVVVGWVQIFHAKKSKILN